MIFLGGYLTNVLRQFRIDERRASLLAASRLLVNTLEPNSIEEENALALERIAEQWAEILDVRITLISTDGVVVTETEGERSLMENHNNRPEVLAAQREGFGNSIRFSNTLGFDTLYVAYSYRPGVTGGGIVRLAVPLDDIAGDIQQLQISLILGAITRRFIGIGRGCHYLGKNHPLPQRDHRSCPADCRR